MIVIVMFFKHCCTVHTYIDTLLSPLLAACFRTSHTGVALCCRYFVYCKKKEMLERGVVVAELLRDLCVQRASDVDSFELQIVVPIAVMG